MSFDANGNLIVAATAGTNLNTSALALETGGNLATIATNTGHIPALGQAVAGSSLPVVLPAAQITTLTPPAAITGFALEAGHLATIDSHTPALGSATSSASVPVVIASDQANVPIQGGVSHNASLSAGSLNADLLAATDVSAFKSFSIQINTNAYSGTITVQGSNDNTNFVSVPVINAGSTNTTGQTTISSSNVLYYGSITYRYLRIRMTSYVSGTAQGTVELYTQPASLSTLGVTVAGTVTNVAATTGGATAYHLIAANTNNAQSVKASAGTVYSGRVTNVAAYAVYLKFYNKASAPTPASDTVVKLVGCPAAAASSAGIAEFSLPVGAAFATGIAIAVVKGIGDTDNTSLAAGDCSVDIDYK